MSKQEHCHHSAAIALFLAEIRSQNWCTTVSTNCPCERPGPLLWPFLECVTLIFDLDLGRWPTLKVLCTQTRKQTEEQTDRAKLYAPDLL